VYSLALTEVRPSANNGQIGGGHPLGTLTSRDPNRARARYREIPCFGVYAAGQASRCFERRLS